MTSKGAWNKWEQTARWVSVVGHKSTHRDDPFAHAETFTVSDGGFDYEVKAWSSPYASAAQSYTLYVRKSGELVCEYSSPGAKPKVEIGAEWLRGSEMKTSALQDWQAQARAIIEKRAKDQLSAFERCAAVARELFEKAGREPDSVSPGEVIFGESECSFSFGRWVRVIVYAVKRPYVSTVCWGTGHDGWTPARSMEDAVINLKKALLEQEEHEQWLKRMEYNGEKR